MIDNPTDTLFKIENAAHSGAFGNNTQSIPTDSQAIAGNYKLGRVNIYGLNVAIEQPRHSYRTGIDSKTGVRWTNKLAANYGFFSGTKGADGDGVDCFIGAYPQSEYVYVINQFVGGRFDEHKVMICFTDEIAAKRAYLDSFDKGWSGFHSMVKASITQLKWWLKHGNMKKSLLPENLPYDGLEKMNKKVFWTAASMPENTTLDMVLYEVRKSDGGENLMLDSVCMKDILENADQVLAFDALVTPYSKLERKMDMLKVVMERAGAAIKPMAVQISDPFKQGGTAQIAVIFELTDGQTVTIYFHNPDVNPKKILPTDELISWKWLLNKKDITVVVAPERGEDLNVRNVAMRIMKLAEKNSAAFKRANANRADKMTAIETIKTEISSLEKELETVQHELEVAKIEAADKPVEKVNAPILYSFEGDTLISYVSQNTDGVRFNVSVKDIDSGEFFSETRIFDDENSAITYAKKSVNYNENPDYSDPEGWAIEVRKTLGDSGWAGFEMGEPMTIEHHGINYKLVTPDDSELTGQLDLMFDDRNTWVVIQSFKNDPLLSNPGVATAIDVIDAMNGHNKAYLEDNGAIGSDKNKRNSDYLLAISEMSKFGDHTVGDYGVDNISFYKNNKGFISLRSTNKQESDFPSFGLIKEDDVFTTNSSLEIIDLASGLELVKNSSVDEAYLFDNASDEFKQWMSEHLTDTEYSPFLTAKAMDEAAKSKGASIQWGFFNGTSLDSVALDSAFDKKGVQVKESDLKQIVDDGDFVIKWNDKITGNVIYTKTKAKVGMVSKTGSSVTILILHQETANPLRAWLATNDFLKEDDQLESLDIDSKFVFDATGTIEPDYVGKISKGDITGRIDIGGDGKAMVFVGDSGNTRVKTPSGITAMYSDDDAEMMVSWLLDERALVDPIIDPVIEPNAYEMTANEYLDYEKSAINDDSAFNSMKASILEQHYASIEAFAKGGGKISDEVFNSLDSGKQFHYTKHYGRLPTKEPESLVNPIAEYLQSVINGEHDNTDLNELLTKIDEAATALIDQGKGEEFDAMIGNAAERWAELDAKKNG